jgi:hypothetical protein
MNRRCYNILHFLKLWRILKYVLFPIEDDLNMLVQTTLVYICGISGATSASPDPFKFIVSKEQGPACIANLLTAAVLLSQVTLATKQ